MGKKRIVPTKICEKCGGEYKYLKWHKCVDNDKSNNEDNISISSNEDKIENEKIKKLPETTESEPITKEKMDLNKIEISDSFAKFVERKHPELDKKFKKDKKALKKLVNVKPFFKGITAFVNRICDTKGKENELIVTNEDYEILSEQFREIAKIKDVKTAFMYNLLMLYGAHIILNISNVINKLGELKEKFSKFGKKIMDKIKHKEEKK